MSFHLTKELFLKEDQYNIQLDGKCSNCGYYGHIRCFCPLQYDEEIHEYVKFRSLEVQENPVFSIKPYCITNTEIPLPIHIHSNLRSTPEKKYRIYNITMKNMRKELCDIPRIKLLYQQDNYHTTYRIFIRKKFLMEQYG